MELLSSILDTTSKYEFYLQIGFVFFCFLLLQGLFWGRELIFLSQCTYFLWPYYIKFYIGGEDLFLLRGIEFLLHAHWSNYILLLEHLKSPIIGESEYFLKEKWLFYRWINRKCVIKEWFISRLCSCKLTLERSSPSSLMMGTFRIFKVSKSIIKYVLFDIK